MENCISLFYIIVFRLQTAGYRDIYEYQSHHIGPQLWPNGLYKRVEVPNGGYMYWNKERECPNHILRLVKIFGY